MRADAQVVAILQDHDGIIGLAKLAGTLDDGLEHRPDIGRRGRDHAEDVGAAGLVGQRLREVAGLRLHLVEQPDVLDRDHRLIGERGEQCDLLVGEGAHGIARQGRTRRSGLPREAGACRSGCDNRQVSALCSACIPDRFGHRGCGQFCARAARPVTLSRSGLKGYPLQFLLNSAVKPQCAQVCKSPASFGISICHVGLAKSGGRLRPACRALSANRRSSG